MLKPKGFTLVEMMIAIVILAVLLSAAIPSFSTFMKNRRVRTATEAVLNGLGLARSEAIRRNTHINFELQTDASWTLGCSTPVGDTNGDGMSDCPGIIQSRPSAEGGAGALTRALTLEFNGYGQVLGLTENLTIPFTSAQGACETSGGNIRCLRIVVSPGGMIRSCDPQTTVTQPGSPKAC